MALLIRTRSNVSQPILAYGHWFPEGFPLNIAISVGLSLLYGYLYSYRPLGIPTFPIDDAYITLQVVKAILTGGQTTFVDSALLAGATSPAHVLLIAAASHFVPTLEWASHCMALATTFAYVLGTAKLCDVYGLSTWQKLFLVLGSAGAGHVSHQLFNGLETGLALAYVTWLLLALIREQMLVVALMAAMAPIVRPELIFLGMSAFAASFVQMPPDNSMPVTLQRHKILRLTLFMVGLLMTLGWSAAYSGGFFSTAAAKKYYFAEGCWPTWLKLSKVGQSLQEFAFSIGPMVLGIIVLNFRRRIPLILISFFVVFAGAYMLDFPGALNHYEHRYMYILLPVFAAAVAESLAFPATRYGSLILTVLLATNILWAPVSIRMSAEFGIAARKFTEQLRSIADWLEHNTDENSVVMVHDAGYVPFLTSRPTVDLVGLRSLPPANIHRETTLPTCGNGRGESIAQIVNKYQPRYFVVLDGWNHTFRLVEGLKDHGYSVRRRFASKPGGNYLVYEIAAR